MQSAVSREQIIALAYHDYNMFATLMLPPEVMFAGIADYHQRVFWRFVSDDIEKYACALPRGHIKTTIAKLAIIWRLIYTDDVFPLYLAGTHMLSERAASDIIALVRSHNFIAIYGECKFIRDRTATGDYSFVINSVRFVNNRAETFEKKITLRSGSAGQKIRGVADNFRRPDFIILDDIDQDEGANGYEVNKSWLYGPVFKIGHRRSKFRQIGNYITTASTIGDHIQDIGWVSDHYSALKPDGTALWPQYWTPDALFSDYMSYVRQGMANNWFAEMLNNPLENANGMVGIGDISFLPGVIPRSGTYTGCFLTVDPAISKSVKANRTAIVVHAYNMEREVWQNVETIYEQGLDPISMFKTLVNLTLKWGCNVWGIEAVAYQASLLPLYKTFLMNADMTYIEVVAAPGSNRSKLSRIIALFGLLKSKQYALSEGQLGIAQRVVQFRPDLDDNADDDLDAMAYFIPMFQQFNHLIFNNKTLVNITPPVITLDHHLRR